MAASSVDGGVSGSSTVGGAWDSCSSWTGIFQNTKGGLVSRAGWETK